MKIYVLLVVLFLVGCKDARGLSCIDNPIEFISLEKIDDDSLAQMLIAYYELENKRLWEGLYELRDAEFRKLVPNKPFENGLSKDLDGWCITKIEVIKSDAVSDKKVYIDLNFYESFDASVGKERFGNASLSGYFSSLDQEIWSLSKDGWKMKKGAFRNRITINRLVQYE